MASPIRPNLFATPPPTNTVGESTGARAAQRAFFDAALGKVDAPVRTAPVAAVSADVARPTQTPQRTPTNAELSTPPTRILRPGSLLDIKV